jgi:hypothetical protein
MDEFQKPADFECYTPSSEPFWFYLYSDMFTAHLADIRYLNQVKWLHTHTHNSTARYWENRIPKNYASRLLK